MTQQPHYPGRGFVRINHLAVMLYVRFPLSLRNLEDLLHERGVDVSYESVRYWWHRFGSKFASEIKKLLFVAKDHFWDHSVRFGSCSSFWSVLLVSYCKFFALSGHAIKSQRMAVLSPKQQRSWTAKQVLLVNSSKRL
jgi:hypothetical protein